MPPNNKEIPLLLLVVISLSCGLMFILCDSLAAFWGKSGSKIALLIVFILAPVGYLLFGVVNSYKTLGVSSSFINILIVLGNIAVGFLVFGESFSSREWAGVVLGFVSLLLLF